MRSNVKKIKEIYLLGMRSRLLKMDDVQAPPVGTEETILGIDDIGSVMVAWDTGSSLNLMLDVDEFIIISFE